ncbi:MAG: hypothetical protein ACLGI3_17640 [Actinomycetes bacterium]
MPRPVMPRAFPLHRAVIGAVLVVAVIVMGGLPALTAAVPSSPMIGMVAMDGMTAEADMLVPVDTPEESALVVGCEGMCGDLLHMCLAVLALLAASAMALPSVQRLIRAEPSVLHARGAGRWAAGKSPPWSVLSLSQLSVLRV